MGMQNDMSLENDQAGFLIHTFRLKIHTYNVSHMLYREAILLHCFTATCTIWGIPVTHTHILHDDLYLIRIK